ncbi:hypothetical protein IJ750_02055 [bacterium]|nr:hypothetical protein [bacterium]MBR1775844.1 hypothetical protein [bacterium]
MSSWISKPAKFFADKVYKHLESGSGAMILATSMLGIAMSSIAQTGAIWFNDKYSPKQKAFMIPQELTEGCITVLSMFLITKPIQKITKNYTKTGKILSKELTEYLTKQNLIDKRGKLNFNVRENIEEVINKIEKSDKYINTSKIEREKLIEKHRHALNSFDNICDSTSAITTTVGSIISTALISPILRNYSASYYQKINMDIYNKRINENSGIQQVHYPKNHNLKGYSGALKI